MDDAATLIMLIAPRTAFAHGQMLIRSYVLMHLLAWPADLPPKVATNATGCKLMPFRPIRMTPPNRKCKHPLLAPKLVIIICNKHTLPLLLCLAMAKFRLHHTH